VAVAVTAAALMLAACSGGSGDSQPGESGGDALAKYKNDGIAVGFADEKPYDYKDASGKVTGEAPELARVILKNMGITKVTFTVVDFDGLIPGLKAGRFDMTAGAASITPQRAKQVLYADPDYCVLEALAVKKGNPKNLSDYKSVAANPDAKLAVESGATELTYAQKAGVKDNQLVKVNNNQAMVSAVKTGRADAFSLTGITVRDLVKTSGGGQLVALEGFNPVIDGKEQVSCGGFQFPKDDQALRDAFTDQLHQLQDQGKVYPIVKPFGFTQQQVDEAKKHKAAELGELSE
jgi:polar amino acid transport system substrate-binding protein